MHHTIFIRVSATRRISREEKGISYVSPCIFPILLEQVNGKRALPCPPFVFHEMSSSRIESLCRDTFARCVIRSPLLLVKEHPSSQSHFHVISEGIFLRERSIADHFTHRMFRRVSRWSYGFLRDSINPISSLENLRHTFLYLFYIFYIGDIIVLTIRYLQPWESKCEHINYMCCRWNFELLFPCLTAIAQMLLIYCLSSDFKYLPKRLAVI